MVALRCSLLKCNGLIHLCQATDGGLGLIGLRELILTFVIPDFSGYCLLFQINIQITVHPLRDTRTKFKNCNLTLLYKPPGYTTPPFWAPTAVRVVFFDGCGFVLFQLGVLALISVANKHTGLLATTWMDLDITILSEVSQRKTHTIWYHLYIESKNKKYKWIYLQNRNGLTNFESKPMVTEGKLGKDKIGVWDFHIHTTGMLSRFSHVQLFANL